MIERIVAYPGGEGNAWADAREYIVRCRDCKHFTPKGTHVFSDGTANDDFCHYIRSLVLQISPDGFCAWGERRGA